MTKRAEPHWRVGEFDSGQPYIILEQYSGEPLELFKRTITFDLPSGTSLEEAKEVLSMLKSMLIRVAES